MKPWKYLVSCGYRAVHMGLIVVVLIFFNKKTLKKNVIGSECINFKDRQWRFFTNVINKMSLI